MTACAQSEQEGIIGHKYASGWRSNDNAENNDNIDIKMMQKSFFCLFIVFKGCMKLEFEPLRVSKDGNLLEFFPLSGATNAESWVSWKLRQSMLNKTKIINGTKPGGCRVLKYEQVFCPKQI